LINRNTIRCEEKELKDRLNKIKQEYDIAKNGKTATHITESLINVYAKLFAFEMDFCNNVGYTANIKRKVYSLYSKIDNEKVKYMHTQN
jgi:hypothetical protein